MSGSFGADTVAHMCLVHITDSTLTSSQCPTLNPPNTPALSYLSIVALRQPHLLLHRLEISSLNKTIRITAKSTKRIREALQPVLGKYGVRMELALLRRVSLHLGGTVPAPAAGMLRGGWTRGCQQWWGAVGLHQRQPVSLWRVTSAVGQEALVGVLCVVQPVTPGLAGELTRPQPGHLCHAAASVTPAGSSYCSKVRRPPWTWRSWSAR